MHHYSEAIRVREILEFNPEAQGWSVVCPELPDCASAGDTDDEACQGIQEATRLYLAPSALDLPAAQAVEVMVR